RPTIPGDADDRERPRPGGASFAPGLHGDAPADGDGDRAGRARPALGRGAGAGDVRLGEPGRAAGADVAHVRLHPADPVRAGAPSWAGWALDAAWLVLLTAYFVWARAFCCIDGWEPVISCPEPSSPSPAWQRCMWRRASSCGAGSCRIRAHMEGSES